MSISKHNLTFCLLPRIRFLVIFCIHYTCSWQLLFRSRLTFVDIHILQTWVDRIWYYTYLRALFFYILVKTICRINISPILSAQFRPPTLHHHSHTTINVILLSLLNLRRALDYQFPPILIKWPNHELKLLKFNFFFNLTFAYKQLMLVFVVKENNR